MRLARPAMNVFRATLALAVAASLIIPLPLFAGGPLYVGGPNFGTDGQIIGWDVSSPVAYRVDGGPLSRTPQGTEVISNPVALTRVQGMFLNWENVPTANIRFTNAGPIQSLPNFTDGDVSTVTEFILVSDDCDAGTQSPIIFDADGSLFSALIGDPSVIGFASICKVDGGTGHIVAAMAVLNGIFQDGIDVGYNFELTTAEFDQAFTHEFGHFAGLDHSQINVNVFNNQPLSCAGDDNAGLPLMFPILYCQARVTSGFPILAPDDKAWISRLYSETGSGPGQTPFNSAYGTISGVVYFSDGVTQAQGVNVIARRISDGNPLNGNETKRIAFSVVSGYRFTGLPGQSVTTPNGNASQYGSRDAQLIGAYEIPVTPGTYTVQVESIDPGFGGGSSVGPMNYPIANPGLDEFWDSGESATDTPSVSSNITVAAGQTVTNINIILNGTPSRFDAFESAALVQPDPPPRWLRREKSARELVDA